MSTAFALKMQGRALDRIAKYGAPVTITWPAAGTDPETGTPGAAPPSPFVTKAAPFRIRSVLIDGITVFATDQGLIIAGDSIPARIVPGCTITRASGDVLSVILPSTVEVQGVVVAYEMIARAMDA